MVRIAVILLGVTLLSLAAADVALAADADWPTVDLTDGADEVDDRMKNHSEHWMNRAGDKDEDDDNHWGYVSGTKILLLWLLFLVWVKTVDWVNRDCYELRLPYSIWNSTVFFPFVAGFFLFALTIPIFFIGYFLLLVCYAAPLGVYVWNRNLKVEPHQRVFTPAHVRHSIATMVSKVGMKMSAEKRAAHEKGAQVEFTPMGAEDDQKNQANLVLARQSPGYITAKTLLAEATQRRAEKVMLDYSKDAVGVKLQIDGMWHDGEAQDREEYDMMLAAMKKMANLDMDQRRQRQEGQFGSAYEQRKFVVTLTSQGTKTGERVVLDIVDPTVHFESLTDLGMREKMQQQITELLAKPNGLVLFSSLPAGGLTTTMTLALKTTDRFMRDFVLLEDESVRPLEVDNVELSTYAAGETPDTVLPKVIRTEPNAMIVPNLPNAETVKILCQQAGDDKMIVGSMRAKDAAETLLRVLALKVPATEFAPAVTGVVCQRLVRRLCDACKKAYTPPPEVLKKLGIPAGRVQQLYRPPTPPTDPKEKYEPCQECNEVGYRGRTSIFELLVVDAGVRAALVKQPKLEVIRKMARKAGNRTMQEEGILLVAKGVTSLPELMRVMK